jgi:hypothetical protein
MGIVGLLLGGWVVFSRRSAVALALFWVAGGLIFTADYAVLDLLEMYHYRPGLLPGLVPDTVLGVFLAELAFVGGGATWLALRLPPWPGIAVGTALVLAIEVLFRRWGIFIGHAWKLWHTAVAFPAYFGLIYWFRAKAEQEGLTGGWVRTSVRVCLTLWWVHFSGMLVYWIMAGLLFQVRWLPTFQRNQALGALLTVAPFMTLAALWAIAARGRERTVRLLWAAAGLHLLGLFWVSVGLWRFRAPWSLGLHTAAEVATLYIAALCDDWIGRWAGAGVSARVR